MTPHRFQYFDSKGFGLVVKKPSPELAARIAVQQHTKLFADMRALDALLFPIGKKKDRQVIQFLYRNADATIEDLAKLIEPEALTPDALRKTIERLNDLFKGERLPLEIVKERGGTGFERVWLDVRH